jgi:putative DNA primase/helicase
MYAELRLRRGWSRDVVEKLGIRLLTHYRKATSPYKLFSIQERRRLAIPIRDDAGTLWNIRTYYPFLEDIPPKGSKMLSWANGHGHARLFPAANTLRPEGPVILCEGESDTICALSHGLNAITQTSKTTYWPEEHTKALTGRDVYIAYDADKPGQEYARKAAKSLQAAGCTVYIITWPDYMGRQSDGDWPEKDGQDLTDFFVKHHKEVHEFTVLLEKARNVQQVPDAQQDNKKNWQRFFRHSASGRWSFGEKLLADYLIESQPMLYHDKSGQLYRWENT